MSCTCTALLNKKSSNSHTAVETKYGAQVGVIFKNLQTARKKWVHKSQEPLVKIQFSKCIINAYLKKKKPIFFFFGGGGYFLHVQIHVCVFVCVCLFVVVCKGDKSKSLAENQKGINAVQRCSVENQKGAIALECVQW